MTAEIWIAAGFFLFVLAAVVCAGYILLRRSGETDLEGAPAPASTREMLVQAFHALGEAVPETRKEARSARGQLVAAGFRAPSAVPIYRGIRWALACLMALLLGWIVLVSRESLMPALTAGLCAAGLGYLIPERILEALIRARAHRLRRGLPSALDLMVLSIEAGHTLDHAVQQCSGALATVHPDLSEELSGSFLELRAGKARIEVLRDLGARNQEPELQKLTTLLIDGDRFGTRLGPSLRTHARYLRIRRRQQAQEAARKIGVKLVFPIFFLIFPSVLLVTLGPAALRIFSELLPTMRGN
ncbi:MAG: type II secretion system F family protein [Bryobacteraceae bacterium]